MSSYYARKLGGRRLRRCYEVASRRVRQYLDAEIEHLLDRLEPADFALELGCGYGRVTARMAEVARMVIGIDSCDRSVALAREELARNPRCEFFLMDAAELAFPEGEIDVVVCVQNGICAFGIEPDRLVREALRVLRPGGRLLLSTYADRFWPERLAWFEAQAAEGLLGPLDRESCRDGTIVCRDGFRSARMTPADLRSLCARFDLVPDIREVDASSVFCELIKPTP